MRKQKKGRSALQKTLLSISQKGGEFLVKLNNTKSKRLKQIGLRHFARKGYAECIFSTFNLLTSTPQDDLVLERILTKLYHIDLGIEDNTRDIVKKNKELATLREERKVRDEEVEAARAQQAKARTAVMQKEKKIKKDEKALEGKVVPSHNLQFSFAL